MIRKHFLAIWVLLLAVFLAVSAIAYASWIDYKSIHHMDVDGDMAEEIIIEARHGAGTGHYIEDMRIFKDTYPELKLVFSVRTLDSYSAGKDYNYDIVSEVKFGEQASAATAGGIVVRSKKMFYKDDEHKVIVKEEDLGTKTYKWNGKEYTAFSLSDSCKKAFESSKELDEANAKFSYKGKPIHPFLVREFSNWLSDSRPPMITTVDAGAAFDTNKYQQSNIEKRDGWWFAKQEEKDGDTLLYEEFGYRWIGKLGNGVHVLETGAGGGGSGFFEDLMLVKFSEGEILCEGKKEKQLLMTVVGLYSLGDRYEGDIKVYSDKVFIPASENQHGGGSIAKDTELKFP